MKKSALWIAALLVLQAGALFAQTLTGTWQGALQIPQAPGGQLRIQIKISTTDADGLKAVMYSIDQGGQPIPASAVTQQGTAVKITIPGIGGAYEAKLDASGASMTGTWTQGPGTLPLTLAHVTDAAAWAIPAAPPPLPRMAADANPSFEVATIKLSRPDEQGKGIRVNGRHINTINTTLSDLVAFAYGIHARQMVGAPDWAESDKFDLTAQPDGEGQPSLEQWKTMIQKLLADRFQFKFHRDKKELSVYALVAGKTEPKLTKSTGNPNGLPSLGLGGLGSIACRNANMADFAGLLQSAVLDRPVVDQTGISGRWDFTLTWTPDEFQFAGFRGMNMPAPADSSAPDLYTAIQQQLGLKLEPTKAQTEVFVVDRVEKPSEN